MITLIGLQFSIRFLLFFTAFVAVQVNLHQNLFLGPEQQDQFLVGFMRVFLVTGVISIIAGLFSPQAMDQLIFDENLVYRWFSRISILSLLSFFILFLRVQAGEFVLGRLMEVLGI